MLLLRKETHINKKLGTDVKIAIGDTPRSYLQTYFIAAINISRLYWPNQTFVSLSTNLTASSSYRFL